MSFKSDSTSSKGRTGISYAGDPGTNIYGPTEELMQYLAGMAGQQGARRDALLYGSATSPAGIFWKYGTLGSQPGGPGPGNPFGPGGPGSGVQPGGGGGGGGNRPGGGGVPDPGVVPGPGGHGPDQPAGTPPNSTTPPWAAYAGVSNPMGGVQAGGKPAAVVAGGHTPVGGGGGPVGGGTPGGGGAPPGYVPHTPVNNPTQGGTLGPGAIQRPNPPTVVGGPNGPDPEVAARWNQGSITPGNGSEPGGLLGMYDKWMRSTGYDQGTLNALRQQTAGAARGASDAATADINRRFAGTGNAAGYYAGRAATGAGAANALTDAAQKTEIANYTEGQRQRELGTAGEQSLYNQQSNELQGYINALQGLSGRKRVVTTNAEGDSSGGGIDIGSLLALL